MVAVIASGAHIRGALLYNENKVAEGKAECIAAVNYPLDHLQMSFTQKLKRLTNQATLNERIKHKCLHLSLNFDPSEQFSNGQLTEMAQAYMEKLGFGDQPFLIYNHQDSSHPHIHIITTTIKENGKPIRLHDLANRNSEPARKAVEEEFSLIRAEGRTLNGLGVLGTKSDISNVVRMVFRQYKYTSFEEYNAILQQFGILADRGAPGTMMFKKGGLQYLKQNGDQLTKPIKASAIFDKPTLKNIQSRYAKHMQARLKFKGRICRVINDSLAKNPTLDQFKMDMEKYRINVLLRINESGFVFGITFIDNQSLCIFNGSDLSKGHSARQILGQLSDLKDWQPVTIKRQKFPKQSHAGMSNRLPVAQHSECILFESLRNMSVEQAAFYLKNIIEDLLESDQHNKYLSSELLKEAKKKAKRRRR